jgi:C-terminal processing protease CtpA/Prc
MHFLPNYFPLNQIGIVLRGCVISELVPGGPAHCCGELNPGDKILRVDGEHVTEDTISLKLIGSDTPETIITLSVSRGIEVLKLNS